MSAPLPVIFLAFANEYHEGRYLNNLVEEHRQLLASLGPVSLADNPKNALCELVVRQNATIQDIFDVFQRYGDRIAIFHYGGHADGYQLLLQGKDGQGKVAHGGGLVSLLGRRKNLKLVFLNGCATQKLARDLASRGVHAVIGTSVSISDTTALQLSSRFYKGLASGITLSGAWEEAKAEVMTGISPDDTRRGFDLRDDDSGRFPWDLEFKDEASKDIFNSWNLPGSANQPLFGLPEPKKQQLPPSPFLFLKPYGAEQAEIFFGRSYYIRDLYLKIAEPNSPPIILLYGESGAGKSSLLDAGLVPRLAAATDSNTGDLLYDVRYQRRDQDLGLIGSLADMLSHYLVEETPEEAQKDDPNLEKIQAIESIAKEMEDEAASSFLSLVERYKAVRTVQAKKAYQHNLYRTGDLDRYAGAQLREAWLQIEKKTGRRLVLILDQVEELFTRPNSKMERELEDLLQVLYDIFGAPAENQEDHIRGKIILGYREEFNAKIEARFKDIGLSRSTVFLEQLNKKDILDIFQGLQSGVVKDHYNISIEDSLPDHVANQLLAGKESVAPGQRPVAPVLQLLLTKLWNKAHRENPHQPAFTVDAFNEVESQGKEMEEYFETQMKKIREWNPEVVESGLALDILAFHITDLGTSKRCFIEDIRSRYRHLAEEYKNQPDIVDQLVNRFKSSEIFLLNDIGRGYTSLPHDTLAPIVMREYNRSDKLGQRSTRILDAKRPDFVRALQVNDTKKVRLDDNDLEVVTGGILGMRALEEEEKTLLQISLEEREKRLKLRRILVRGGIVTGLFILFLGIVSGLLTVSMVEQIRNVVVDRAHVESLKIQENNSDSYKDYLLHGEEEYAAGEETRLAHFAYHAQGEEKRLDVVQNYFKLAGPAEEEGKMPYFLTLDPPARMLGLDYDRSKGLVAPLGFGDQLAYWPLSGYYAPTTIDFTEYVDVYFEQVVGGAPTNVERTAAYSADGKGVQVQMRNEAAPLYEMAGQLVPAPTLAIRSEYTGDDGQLSYDTIGHYDLFSGEFVGDYGVRLSEDEFNKVYEYLTPMVGEIPLEGSYELFSWKLMDDERQVFSDTVYQQLKESGWKISGASRIDLIVKSAKSGANIALRPTRSFSRATGNYCMVWNSGDENAIEPAAQFFHYDPLDYLTALSTESFLTVNPEGLLAIWNNQGTISNTLLPSGTSIADVGVSPDHRHIFAITKDSALVWTLEGARAGAWAHANVRKHVFSADGARFFTQSNDTIRVWQREGKAAPAYVVTDTAYQIATARFQEDGKRLVIGLDPKSAEKPKEGLLQLFGKKGNSARIDYWDVETGKVEQTFETPCLHLADASVSPDGKFAVALDPGNAYVIPSSQFKIRQWEYNGEGIKPEPMKKGDTKSTERVFLSPGGKYIVRQSFTENRIQLFDQKGKLVNAYLYGQFSPGFRGEFFTPDDQYLVAKRANEAFLWRPEDGNIPWPEIAELSMYEKRQYELDTFFDAAPGTKDVAKWWALGLLGIALIYSLVFFSGAIINYVQGKDYLSLGLYGAAFLILNLLLGAAWAIGFEDPGMKKVAFYGLVLANLGILGIGIFQTRKKGKWQNLIPLGIVALLLAVGLVQFAALESAQLKAFEWPLVAAFVLLAVFTGLAGYPVFRAIRAYRKDNKLAFYRWLLLPSAFASLIIWGAISIAITSGDLTPALDVLAGLTLTAIVIHKCAQYFRNRAFWALGAFAVPAILIVSMLSVASQAHIVAMAGVFVYGWQAYKQQAYGKAYLFISASIFLLAGTLSQFFITAEFIHLIGALLLAPALVLLFYAISTQLKRMPVRQAAGRSRLPNWLAILSLWIAGFVGAGLYSDEAMVYDEVETYSDEYYAPEYTEEEEYSDLLTGIMAEYPVWQSVFDEVNRQSTFFESEEGYYLEIKDDQIIAEFEVTESAPEYVEIYDASRRLKLRLFEDRALFQNDGDPKWYFLFEGEWIQPAVMEGALESDETGMEE
ncbi:MAG: CHAT domain-containing protein [Saprospiraceae bacterium]